MSEAREEMLAAAAAAAAAGAALATGVAENQQSSPRSVVRPERARVEDAVSAQIQARDPDQALRLSDYQDVLFEVSDKVLRVMEREDRDYMDDDDRDFVARRVRKMVRTHLDKYEEERSKPTRFRRAERAVCRIGGERAWASGVIASVNEDNPEDPYGPKLPYVVKIDPPVGRLISVPNDEYDLCRAEVCFGQRAGALLFTLFCLPPARPRKGKRRFAEGERVACAIEDETNDYSVWAAGTVLEVDHSIEERARELLPERQWAGGFAVVPYRVGLDSGGEVLVHRDEHWLVRDLALQSPGPRQVPIGSDTKVANCLTRLERRHKGDYTWEAVDHMTRRVRPCEAPSDDEHADDCEGCEKC